ncbi:hypothetical protein JW766_05770 [Candidatus Dojkabacteria bacterium]|nr:hypothetical protein [Candidatus Dojkabacteria bacterium]
MPQEIIQVYRTTESGRANFAPNADILNGKTISLGQTELQAGRYSDNTIRMYIDQQLHIVTTPQELQERYNLRFLPEEVQMVQEFLPSLLRGQPLKSLAGGLVWFSVSCTLVYAGIQLIKDNNIQVSRRTFLTTAAIISSLLLLTACVTPQSAIPTDITPIPVGEFTDSTQPQPTPSVEAVSIPLSEGMDSYYADRDTPISYAMGINGSTETRPLLVTTIVVSGIEQTIAAWLSHLDRQATTFPGRIGRPWYTAPIERYLRGNPYGLELGNIRNWEILAQTTTNTDPLRQIAVDIANGALTRGDLVVTNVYEVFQIDPHRTNIPRMVIRVARPDSTQAWFLKIQPDSIAIPEFTGITQITQNLQGVQVVGGQQVVVNAPESVLLRPAGAQRITLSVSTEAAGTSLVDALQTGTITQQQAEAIYVTLNRGNLATYVQTYRDGMGQRVVDLAPRNIVINIHPDGLIEANVIDAEVQWMVGRVIQLPDGSIIVSNKVARVMETELQTHLGAVNHFSTGGSAEGSTPEVLLPSDMADGVTPTHERVSPGQATTHQVTINVVDADGNVETVITAVANDTGADADVPLNITVPRTDRLTQVLHGVNIALSILAGIALGVEISQEIGIDDQVGVKDWGVSGGSRRLGETGEQIVWDRAVNQAPPQPYAEYTRFRESLIQFSIDGPSVRQELNIHNAVVSLRGNLNLMTGTPSMELTLEVPNANPIHTPLRLDLVGQDVIAFGEGVELTLEGDTFTAQRTIIDVNLTHVTALEQYDLNALDTVTTVGDLNALLARLAQNNQIVALVPFDFDANSQGILLVSKVQLQPSSGNPHEVLNAQILTLNRENQLIPITIRR